MSNRVGAGSACTVRLHVLGPMHHGYWSDGTPSPNKMTDVTENITLPQLHWRAVITDRLHNRMTVSYVYTTAGVATSKRAHQIGVLLIYCLL